MSDWLITILGFAAGWIAAATWIKATSGWKKARGMLKAPEKARAERSEKAQEARAMARTGWSELFRSILFYLLLFAIVASLILFVSLFRVL